MGLPVELRLKVYRSLLVFEDAIEIWPEVGSATNDRTAKYRAVQQWSRLIRRRKLNLGILRLCKVVHDEASEVFYGENEFRFSAVNGQMVAAAFIHHIRPRHAKHVQALAIGMPFWAHDRGCVYGSAWCVDSITGGYRLNDMMPWGYPHKGACYYEKSFASLAADLVKAGNLKVLKLVLPDWFEQRLGRRHDNLWKALGKIMAGLPSLEVEVVYLYQNLYRMYPIEEDAPIDDPTDTPSYEELSECQKFLLYELHQKGVQRFHLGGYEEWDTPWEPIPCAVRFDNCIANVLSEMGQQEKDGEAEEMATSTGDVEGATEDDVAAEELADLAIMDNATDDIESYVGQTWSSW
ncbi:hypothetical protein K491DRAFT_340258 [Lophiostoma macrostomum CBS 122681]|uniref:Uncharacterized protein n=1 Tax=Lophiostoma macrostomum CBS 122681 TaxID=1314788 RepID=A0A6A6TPT2_9PLEO|nr:hypothetical protein K491DRAFT_340258 [Lophiostoma macrostomum CBS 122681]